MDEKSQGNPGHALTVPDHADLKAMPAAPDAVPEGIEVIKPNADYEAQLIQEARNLAQQGMKHIIGPQPAQANIPAIQPQAPAMPAAPPITAAEIKRSRGRPVGWRKNPQAKEGEANHSRTHRKASRTGQDLARERGRRENAPAASPPQEEGDEGAGSGSQTQSGMTAIPTQTGPSPVPPAHEDKEVRAAAVAMLRKLESLSSEWRQRIDALRVERRMTDDKIVLMLLARGLDSPDYLETPPDHPFFADSFTPAGTPFTCVVCGKVQSMLYPGQRPICVDGTNVCANKFNQLTPEDQQELMSEVA